MPKPPMFIFSIEQIFLIHRHVYWFDFARTFIELKHSVSYTYDYQTLHNSIWSHCLTYKTKYYTLHQ